MQFNKPSLCFDFISLTGSLILFYCFTFFLSCQREYPEGSFAYDVERLAPIQGLEILENENAMIAVSGAFQGRVFTSTSNGMSGRSYGWVNWDLIKEGVADKNMAGLGGESRMWFAPEWGPNSLFFDVGAEQIDANIRPPQDLHNIKFTKIKESASSVTYTGKLQLTNINNFTFPIEAQRSIQLLGLRDVEQKLQLELNEEISVVGFSVSTRIKNIGAQTFQKETGLISIWELGCMLTSLDTRVILPLRQAVDSIQQYFKRYDDRIKIKGNTAFYKADAKRIHKIGIPSAVCKPIMGSYSPSQKLLNIVSFQFDNDSLYVNSVPDNTTPYLGDVINIFNGELSDQWNLPFYEFESVSAAKELKPEETISHYQTTYHFEGAPDQLSSIAEQLLGVRLEDIPNF